MKRFLLFFVTAILIIGCADDIIIPPASDIRGVYEGKYIIVTDDGRTIEQYIIWTLSDNRFWSVADRLDDLPKVFCDLNGFYKLEEKLNLSDVGIGDQQCDHAYILSGEFSMRRPDDSLLLEQYDVDLGAHKYVKVVRTE